MLEVAYGRRIASTDNFLKSVKCQPRRKGRISIRNKHNSRPTTNIDTVPHILWPRFP
jgi:hypothetical protein